MINSNTNIVKKKATRFGKKTWLRFDSSYLYKW